MLLSDFFTVERCTVHNQEITAHIVIHPGHAIFKGHFPGQPVVPGVCMVQIVKELLEQQLAKVLCLRESSQMKFLQLLTPSDSQELQVHISFQPAEQSGILKVMVNFRTQDALLFKMQGVFSENIPKE